jgi:hypothetical protein
MSINGAMDDSVPLLVCSTCHCSRLTFPQDKRRGEHLSFFSDPSGFLRAKATPENIRVSIYFLLLVLSGIANNISGRWNQIKFGNNYAFFNNQFTTLMYAFIAQAVTSYKYYFTKDLSPEMLSFPKWKFAMFGFFDGSAAFLFSIGAPSTPATLQNVINQTIIPATMLASFIFLRAR